MMKSIVEFKKGIHDSLKEKVASKLLELKQKIAGEVFSSEHLEERISGAAIGGAAIGGVVGGVGGAAIGAAIGGAASVLDDAAKLLYRKANNVAEKDIEKCKGKGGSEKNECIMKAYINSAKSKIAILQSAKSKANDKQKSEIDVTIKKLKASISNYTDKIAKAKI